jgi:molybdenum cofactor synthesis domain-containing protein
VRDIEKSKHFSEAHMTSPSPAITASILVIGDEILSGRTKDKNIGYIAEYLTKMGIDLREVRVVPDVADEIVSALNALRVRYTYVFTTGGIGPTHDDITADCVAKAFGVPIDHDDRAVAMLKERYSLEDLNEGRLRMARIPHGASLINNPISKAPGFRVENVIVMAGVPHIMQVMLDDVAATLKTGTPLIVETIDCGKLTEGLYTTALAEVAKAHHGVSIGSYPSFHQGGFRSQIVIRGRDLVEVEAAKAAVNTMLAEILAFNQV